MKFAKMTLMGIGGLALAGLLLIRKAAHAVVATLVEVVNTTANPVPNLDTERNARIPYESIIFVSVSAGVGSTSPLPFTTVPAGYRLVAQSVSASLTLANAATAPFCSLASVTNPALVLGLPGTVGPALGVSRPAGFTDQITAYFDAGDTPQITLTADFKGGSVEDSLSLTGYLENCAITGCPAIQH